MSHRSQSNSGVLSTGSLLYPQAFFKLYSCLRAPCAFSLAFARPLGYAPAMAVFTPLTTDDLRTALAGFRLGKIKRVHPVAEGSEHTVHMLETSDHAGTETTYVHILFEQRLKPADLPALVSLHDHLAKKNMPTPRLLRDGKGDAIHKVKGKPAALMSFVPGRPILEATPMHCTQVGSLLARFHKNTGDLPKEPALTKHMGLDDLLRMQGEMHTASPVGPLAEMLATLSRATNDIEKQKESWRSLPGGACHADLFMDNVFFAGDDLSGLIDLWFACDDPYAYDLAIALSAWGFSAEGDFLAERFQALLGGYQQVRPLNAEEHAALPALLIRSAVRFLTTRLHDALFLPDHPAKTGKNPGPWHKILRFHLDRAAS